MRVSIPGNAWSSAKNKLAIDLEQKTLLILCVFMRINKIPFLTCCELYELLKLLVFFNVFSYDPLIYVYTLCSGPKFCFQPFPFLLLSYTYGITKISYSKFLISIFPDTESYAKSTLVNDPFSLSFQHEHSLALC